MKTFKLINSYFFGVDEIETIDGLWFYGFIAVATVFAIGLLIAKLTF